MRPKYRKVFILSIIGLSAAVSPNAAAQFAVGSSINGIVRSPAPLPSSLGIEVREIGTQSLAGYSNVGLDGTFEVSVMNAKQGHYQVVLVGPEGAALQSTQVWLPTAAPVTLHLPAPKPAASPGEHTVSLARLKYAPSPKAERQFARAHEALAEGNVKKARKRFEKALEIHPQYIEARNNLGALYLRTQSYEQAIEQFQKALELDPSSVQALTNLSIALRGLGRLEEAETAARQAVAVRPSSSEAQFSLGLVLWDLKEDPRDAVDALQQAAREIPEASLLATDILLDEGELQAAQTELRKFLVAGGR